MSTVPAVSLDEVLERTGELLLTRTLSVEGVHVRTWGDLQVRLLETQTIDNHLIGHALKFSTGADSGQERTTLVPPSALIGLRRAIKKMHERLEGARRDRLVGVFELTYRCSAGLLMSTHIASDSCETTVTVGEDRPDHFQRPISAKTSDVFLFEFAHFLGKCEQTIEERPRAFADM